MTRPNLSITVKGSPSANASCQYRTVILRPDIPFAAQVTEPDVKYVVKYDYSLGGENVTVPENCLFEFDGGSISNGTLTGNNTVLILNNQKETDVIKTALFGTFRRSVMADEEWLHFADNNVMQMKDREYSPTDYSGLGKIYLKKNMQNVYLSNTWMFKKVNDVVYLMYSALGKIYGIYDESTSKGLVLASNVVTETSSYNLEDVPDVVTDYLTYTKAGGIYTIILPDNTTITSTQLNNTVITQLDYSSVEVNLLTQAMINKANTVYIIQYDFVLNDATVTIPEGCVLKFEGGSISNGVVIGSGTIIDANTEKIFRSDLTLSGRWKIEGVYSEWFGAEADGNTDCTTALQKAIDNVFSINDNVPIKLLAGTYNISLPLDLHKGQHISIIGTVEKHKTVIKAVAQMTGMIRYNSDSPYDYTQNIYIANFTLDGNRQTSGNEQLPSSPAMATDGILIGGHDDSVASCMIYSTIHDMLFLNIDGFAISIAAWATHIYECGFGYCENGIFGYSGNGLVIEKCGFNYIKKVGTHNGGYGIVIRDNIYDVLGHCAIIISSESKALIDGNYFEETSINGINMYSALLGSGVWYPSQTSKIHPVIYAGTGTGTIRSDRLLHDPVTPHEYGFGRGFASQVTVTNNYVDSPESADNRFFVFGSAIMSAKITDNICRDSDNQRYAFGTILDSNCSLVHDVEISRNWNFDNPNTEKRPMPRFGGIQGPYVYWSDCWCYNIYTNDDTEDPSLDGDIIEKCIFRIAYDGVIEEVDEKYQGRQVFYCDGCVNPNETMAVYLDVSTIDGHVVFDPSVYANKTVEVSYYRRAYGSTTWEHVRVNGCYGLARVWVVFPSKGFITLPSIRVAGSRQIEGIAVHRPIAYGNSCMLEDKHIIYLPGTELRLQGNDYARRAYIESNTNGGYNHVTTNIRVETDMPQIEQADLTALAAYPRAIRGMTAVNSDNSKPVWFDGTAWKYYDGTTI